MHRRFVSMLGGVLLDARLGDPPTALHPVALIGRAASAARRHAPEDAEARRRYGVAAALGIVAVSGGAASWAERRWPPLLGGRVVAGAALLALASSRRTLLLRTTEVADALDRDDLPEARRLLAMHLVSRDTAALDASEVAGAAIESVAENLHDGVVGPWLAYALAGSGGAWAYRAANTLDAMWGYHRPFLEELGMGAARLDDLLNLAPARVGAAAICLAAALHGEDAGGALRTWRRDAALTESPNAGAPIAAMAGALGIVLAKRESYAIGAEGRPPEAADIRRACRLVDTAAHLVAGGLATALLARGAR